ncbi:MAG: GAF domain-containing protein [Cyanosarcina radialis HA8281-LM2]|jgi:PAS domain S-box-containing protein|nr:GAF domain-containing protein [Cyanosarcina radialis HA8281-LM2]
MPDRLLLVLKGSHLTIQQVSGDAMEIIGKRPQLLLKKKLKDILGKKQSKLVKQYLHKHQEANHPLELAVKYRKQTKFVWGTLHRLGKLLILELVVPQQAEVALRQQVQRERLLAETAQRIRKSLDLREILQTTVKEVRSLLQADRVLVYRVWANGTGSAIAEATSPGWIKVLDFVFPEEVFPEEARHNYLQGRIYTLADRDRGEVVPCLVDFLAQIQVRAKLVIPIVQKDNLWGLLIAHQCGQPRTWQDWEVNLLQQLATQLAIAIQQSELYQQLQEELTERQRIENALRQSEALFRSLSESSPIGIFRTDATGAWIYVNPRCQAIGDFTWEAALGDGWQRFIHSEDRAEFSQQWQAATADNQEFSSEIRFVKPDGTVRFCRLRTAPVSAAREEIAGHVGTVEDITESRAIAQMKNEFISIVSHELRTPLTAIRGSLGLVANGVYDRKPQRGQRMLQIAATQTDRLVRLVNDILDLGRLESGRVALVKQPCDAATLMLQSGDTMRGNAEQHGITLSVVPLKIEVWAAPDSIVQVLTNLIGNAIKFSQPCSTVLVTAEAIRASAQASANAGEPTPYVLFQVKDQGRGIPADKLESVFGQFQQVDASDSRKKGGTGLGLTICRSIIQQHGGRIWAESILGAGSTFYFTLPVPPDSSLCKCGTAEDGNQTSAGN